MIRAKLASFSLHTPGYWTSLNNTCAETALDVIDDWYISLGLPSGESSVRVPSHLASYTDSMALTTSGVTNFSLVNPYALYSQMVAEGFIPLRVANSLITDSRRRLVSGVTDPLVTYGFITP